MSKQFTQRANVVYVDNVPMAWCTDAQSAAAVREALELEHGGKPLSWWRVVAWLLGAALVAGAVIYLFTGGPIDG